MILHRFLETLRGRRNLRLILLTLPAILVLCILAASQAQPLTQAPFARPSAQDTVGMTVTGKSLGRMPIVVMPFTAGTEASFAGALPQTLRDLVDADLQYSGYFNVQQPDQMPSDTVLRVQWTGSKWDTLLTFGGNDAPRVHGVVEAGWEGITANISILRPPLVDPEHTKSFQFNADDVRMGAHRIAAWVTKMLTGETVGFTSRIVFVVKSAGNKNLWIMDWDGANPRSLTSDRTTNMSPTWSPDGNTIYFTSFRGGNADIYRLTLGSRQITPFITSPRVDSAPAVSPDGQWIAYMSSGDGNAEIYRIRPDGSGRTQLTISYGVDTSPSWAPTGQHILFTSDRGGTPQIYKMDVDGAGVQRLTFAGEYNETARWSPRGDWIAFASREIGFQIFTIAPDGSGERRVTDQVSSLDPSWSPDGMKLVYTLTQGGKNSIWTCNWDGSDPRQLTAGLDASQPQWGPPAFADELEQ